MADESKLREQVNRGETARVVLKEIKDAKEALEKQCFDAFRKSAIQDTDGRTMCRLYLKALDDVVSRFETFVRTGEQAHTELVRLKDPSRLMRMVGSRGVR